MRIPRRIPTMNAVGNCVHSCVRDVAHIGSKVNLYPNDWYDPNFLRNYADNATISSIDDTKCDFAWARSSVTPLVVDGYNCVQYIFPNTTLFSIAPSFTRAYLTSKGYVDGDTARIGFWLKVPLASPTKTYRLYKGGLAGSASDPAITISNGDWNWYEVINDKVINIDTWQTFYLGVRDGLAGEKMYVRGLTLVNTAKDEWTGERVSYREIRAQKQSFLNLNGHFKHSPVWNDLFTRSVEQNSNPFTVEQIEIQDLGIKGARFTGVANTQMRINSFPFLEYFSDIKRVLNHYGINSASGYMNIGMYVEVQSAMAYNGFYAFTGLRNDTRFMDNIPHGQRVWVETGPISINDAYWTDNSMSAIQLNVTANAGVAPVMDVYGVTVSVSQELMQFRYQPNTIASTARFKDKIIASYGDSITSSFVWQKPILLSQGSSDHYERGIGGSTVRHNGTIAWVDADGKYISRPPSAPPAGTEGVDYFEIDGSMCRQERVDTIPVDSDVVFVMAGANDYGQDTTIGTINDVASDLTGATFYAAFKSMLNKLQTRLPNKELIILNLPYKLNELTDLNTNGNSYENFREAIRALATLYELEIIETNDVGVNDANWANYSADTVHPNHFFGQLIGWKIVESL